MCVRVWVRVPASAPHAADLRGKLEAAVDRVCGGDDVHLLVCGMCVREQLLQACACSVSLCLSLTGKLGKAFLHHVAHDAIGVEDKVLAREILAADVRHHSLHLLGELEHLHLGVLSVGCVRCVG